MQITLNMRFSATCKIHQSKTLRSQFLSIENIIQRDLDSLDVSISAQKSWGILYRICTKLALTQVIQEAQRNYTRFKSLFYEQFVFDLY